MMGGGGMMDGGDMMSNGDHIWTINGVSATEHTHAPILFLKRGRPYVLRPTEQHRLSSSHPPAWPCVPGDSAKRRADAVAGLTAPKERVEIAFFADNPGDWMIHCHILEHQAGGMMATVRIE